MENIEEAVEKIELPVEIVGNLWGKIRIKIRIAKYVIGYYLLLKEQMTNKVKMLG